MSRLAIAALLALCAATASADEWTGPDKNIHFAAGAAVGTVVTMATDDEWAGFAAGATVGLLKELWDEHHPPHQATVKDFIVTAAGGLVGAKIGGLVVMPGHVFVKITF